VIHAPIAQNATIGDLAADPRFGLAVIAASPEALDRPISWVHVTEVVDPRPHIRQDELVCTVGAALVDPGRPPGSCKRSRTRVAIDRLPIETAETAKAHRG